MWWIEHPAVMSTAMEASIAVDGVSFPTSLADMTAGGLLITFVAFFILSIARGWIVVKIHYDAALKRAETAEAAVASLTANNAVQAQTILKQTAVGETVVRVMNSAQDALASSKGSS